MTQIITRGRDFQSCLCRFRDCEDKCEKQGLGQVKQKEYFLQNKIA